MFVGGFLGAGKTTLILKAAETLRAQGQRVAVIMNDQDAALVDTLQSQANDFPTSEVAGGCFCCRFSDLLDAADQLASYRPEIIFAEPVGSCVDLSATILQPLLAFHRDKFRVAPLTVLLDPLTAARLDSGELPGDTQFLIRNQIAEADLLCVTKKDIHGELPQLSVPVDFHLSAQRGDAVQAWLNEVLSSKRVTGARLLDVDYDRYAEAEAALGWLNLHAEIRLDAAASPALIAGPLLDQLNGALTAGGIEIAHLKIFDRAATGWVRASISSNGDEPQPQGDILAEAAIDHQLAINLRAIVDPESLRDLVTRALQEFGSQIRILHLRAFRPSRPVPEHRFTTRANQEAFLQDR